MSKRLHIQGEYPPDWETIGDRVREEAGHRCIRCGHPFRTGAHGKGQWTPCDKHCTHGGPIGYQSHEGGEVLAEHIVQPLERIRFRRVAEWRILTVHHMDGDKSNCQWWNLLALCQRCHLQIQTRLNPKLTYFLEHSDWVKPYVAGFYAHKYEGRNITREEAMQRLNELLAYERLA